MQAAAVATLYHKVSAANVTIRAYRSYSGPRRIALWATLDAQTPRATFEARGPRLKSPEAAIAGFAAKHGAALADLTISEGYYVLHRSLPEVSVRELLITSLPGLLHFFSWPKSMRWGESEDFSWVRPLRRIVCLLDGEVLPVTIGPITAGNETEGHRVLAPEVFAVSSGEDWERKLRAHYVVPHREDREQLIAEGLKREAAARGLMVVEDTTLLDQVSGLVEWPVPLIGRIDKDFMSLPMEVRELSMRVNQRFFALRDLKGEPAPYFAFVANQETPDGGVAIVAGNERVLRARLSDARHFWQLDLKTPLDDLMPKLGRVIFHAKIGTQLVRAERIAKLAKEIAEVLGADGYEVAQAGRAGLLCKADLLTGMVGEFPELQGIMGGYYAERYPLAWDGAMVGSAIRSHYQPKGLNDAVPSGIVPVSVALADKIDTLREFFRIGEVPTGSGDPYALRRAALGVIRIILENKLRLPLRPLLAGDEKLSAFIIERLRVKLRGEGRRFDILNAVLDAGEDDDLTRLLKKVQALGDMLKTEKGRSLLVAYRRANSIVDKEEAADKTSYRRSAPDAELFPLRMWKSSCTRQSKNFL